MDSAYHIPRQEARDDLRRALNRRFAEILAHFSLALFRILWYTACVGLRNKCGEWGDPLFPFERGGRA
jgi:hypothetical protein